MSRDRPSGRRWQQLRTAILRRSTICWLCGKPGSDTIDHVIPIALGGARWDLRNLRPAHRSCNRAKGTRIIASDRTSEDWL